MDVTYPIGVSVVVGKQGRVVVPAELRSQLALEVGEELFARVSGRQLILERPQDMLRDLQDELRALPNPGSVVDELLAERRAEAAAE